MLEVELLACEALAKQGVIPLAAARRIRRKARLNVAKIGEREGRTRHDVVAFLEELASHIGRDARYLHLGLTSSDALDTATGVQLKDRASGYPVRIRDDQKQFFNLQELRRKPEFVKPFG